MTAIDQAFNSIKINDTNKLQELIVSNADLCYAVNDEQVSLLMYAIYHRNDIAKSLIASFKKEISIYEAVCMGNMEVTKKELESNPVLLNAFSPDGFTLLGFACFFGQLPMALYLIEWGAIVNQASANAFNVFPIHSACAIANLGLVELLIWHGADVNVRQKGGFTPLHSAVMNKASAIELLLLENGAG